MNEIINRQNENQAVQTAQERAVFLDGRIKANAQIAAESVAAMGCDLKAIRDERLYIELGCDNFSEYCEQKLKIGQRHAYNFIKCYETYGEQLSTIQYLGITKLVAMTVLDEEDRTTLIESGKADDMSSRELEKEIEELKNKCEQLTMQLEEAENKSEETEISETEVLLKKQNEELFKELEALKSVQNRQEQTDNSEKEKLKSEIELLKKQNKDLSQVYAKESSDNQKKLEENAAKKQREAEKKHAAEIEKLKEQIAEAEEKAILQANAKKQAPPDSQKERVKFYCEECLRAFNSAIEAVNSVENGEAKEKCLQAITTIVKKMEELIQ